MSEQEGMPEFGVDPDYAKKIREKLEKRALLRPSDKIPLNEQVDSKINPGKPKEFIKDELNKGNKELNKNKEYHDLEK